MPIFVDGICKPAEDQRKTRKQSTSSNENNKKPKVSNKIKKNSILSILSDSEDDKEPSLESGDGSSGNDSEDSYVLKPTRSGRIPKGVKKQLPPATTLEPKKRRLPSEIKPPSASKKTCIKNMNEADSDLGSYMILSSETPSGKLNYNSLNIFVILDQLIMLILFILGEPVYQIIMVASEETNTDVNSQTKQMDISSVVVPHNILTVTTQAIAPIQEENVTIVEGEEDDLRSDKTKSLEKSPLTTENALKVV